MQWGREAPVDEAWELLGTAAKVGAHWAEAQDDVQAVSHAPQEEAVEIVRCVRHPCMAQPAADLL